MLALSKMLIGGGVVLLVCGLVMYGLARSGFNGLPGDISWKRDNVSVYFPIVTCIVLSLVATLVLNILARFIR